MPCGTWSNGRTAGPESSRQFQGRRPGTDNWHEEQLDLLWCLTFDTSGGAKGAKRPLRHALDGGVRRLVEGLFLTLAAMEGLAESLGPTFLRHDPGPIGPWRIVANVLVVTAFELRHPMVLLVLVEAHDPSIHGEQGA